MAASSGLTLLFNSSDCQPLPVTVAAPCASAHLVCGMKLTHNGFIRPVHCKDLVWLSAYSNVGSCVQVGYTRNCAYSQVSCAVL